MWMQIDLVAMPASLVVGIYGKSKNEMPSRARFLQSKVAGAYAALMTSGKPVKVSDMCRSPESSLAAVKAGRGAQRPGYSGHNYGFSIDVDVTQWLKSHSKGRHKEELDEFMNEHGWYCHRKDHLRAMEDWHYNYFGDDPDRYLAACARKQRTASGLEQLIQDHYGDAMTLTKIDVQTALESLHLYAGAIDGLIGPISKEAILAFQRAWMLTTDGDWKGPQFQRTLSFVAGFADLQERVAAGEIPIFS